MPVDPMLAAPTAALPAGQALSGGCWYEPKFDGYRALVFVDDDGARVQSRRGHDITSAFPDIAAAAAEQLPAGAVLDGELLIWVDDRPDFARLQHRLASRKTADQLATEHPASLIAFDILASAGHDLRVLPLVERRSVLEHLASAMKPPLQLSPGTADPVVAEQWMADYARVDVGIEGLVIKSLAGAYQSGVRGWLKYKSRDTADAIVGAVIGTPENPERLVLGRYDVTGDLRVVGSTHELHRPQRLELREHLFTAEGEHPWPAEISSGGLGHWGGGKQAIHRVEPSLVVEVSADRAFDKGRWRHQVKFVRTRPDVDSQEVPLRD